MPLTDVADSLFTILARRDRAAAIEVITRLLAAGTTAQEVVVHVLAPVQRRVGIAWERGTWSVADEHAATTIVSSLLDRLDAPDWPRDGRDLVLVCAEGEWHSVAAHMLAVNLRARGHRVSLLGASVPASDVRRFLDGTISDALLVSCTIPGHLVHARRSIHAAQDAGVPVIVGGAAFGPDGRRAVRLGADGWASSVTEIEALCDGWTAQPPTPRPVGSPSEPQRLQAARHDIVRAALERMLARGDALSGRDHQALLVVSQAVADVVTHAAAAVEVDDPAIFHDHLRWLHGMLPAHGGPPDLLHHMIPAVAVSTPVTAEATRALLATAGVFPRARPHPAGGDFRS